MHPQASNFVLNSADYVTWNGARVIEVGAQDVNGAVRNYIEEAGYLPDTWVGFDLVPGPGVDVVGDAADTLATVAGIDFDIAVSTEVLEHAERWSEIVVGMINALRQGGWLIITCAAPGRGAHGASGGEWAEDEFYENVSLEALRQVIEAHGMWMLRGEQSIDWPQDTRLVAVKL